MENEPFEDVFPIENGDFPLLCYVSLPAKYHHQEEEDMGPSNPSIFLPKKGNNLSRLLGCHPNTLVVDQQKIRKIRETLETRPAMLRTKKTLWKKSGQRLGSHLVSMARITPIYFSHEWPFGRGIC